MSLTPEVRAALETEALRIYRRYQRELVEGHSLCPWAEKAREDGNVTPRVLLEDDELTAAAMVEELAADPEVHVGLLIFPRSTRGRHQHERFMARLRERHAAAHQSSPPLVMASFHYDADPNLDSPARLVPFIRRTPDPTVQLVRIRLLDELRAPFDAGGTGYINLADVPDIAALLARPVSKPLHERIAQHNFDLVQRVGVDVLEAKMLDIRRDRDESYAKILGG